MPEPPTTSYDELPYADHVFALAQPANLATVAILNGLEPPPLDRCRVLDVGCAAGFNLLPMGPERPGSRLVGPAQSPRQIAPGRENVPPPRPQDRAPHVPNLPDPADGLGPFHYIVCQGVYSWVPPAVQ